MCSICLSDDVDLLLSCQCKTTYCRECFNNSVLSSTSSGKLFTCLCKEVFDQGIVCSLIDNEKREGYNRLCIEKSINMYSCGFCLEVCDITDFDKSIYFCYKCRKNSCFKCKKEPHEGNCEKGKDEIETEKFILQCCGSPFFRGDGCNKVMCPKCFIPHCWICKAKNVTYKHFVSQVPGCLLVGEREQCTIIPNYDKYASLKVSQLKILLKERKLSGHGLKAQLVERLSKYEFKKSSKV